MLTLTRVLQVACVLAYAAPAIAIGVLALILIGIGRELRRLESLIGRDR